MLRRDSQLNLKGVMPKLFHVVPIDNLATLDWSCDGQNAFVLLSIGTHINIVVIETDHDGGHLGPSNDL